MRRRLNLRLLPFGLFGCFLPVLALAIVWMGATVWYSVDVARRFCTGDRPWGALALAVPAALLGVAMAGAPLYFRRRPREAAEVCRLPLSDPRRWNELRDLLLQGFLAVALAGPFAGLGMSPEQFGLPQGARFVGFPAVLMLFFAAVPCTIGATILTLNLTAGALLRRVRAAGIGRTAIDGPATAPRPGEPFQISLTQGGSTVLDGLMIALTCEECFPEDPTPGRRFPERGWTCTRLVDQELLRRDQLELSRHAPFVAPIDISLPANAKASFESQQHRIRWLVRVVLQRRGRTVERSFRLVIAPPERPDDSVEYGVERIVE
jgi:hypothetical protein